MKSPEINDKIRGSVMKKLVLEAARGKADADKKDAKRRRRKSDEESPENKVGASDTFLENLKLLD